MSRQLIPILSLSLLLAAAPASADDASLAGTKWLSEAEHTRVTVDHRGEVTLKTGKYLYVEVLAESGGVYAVKKRWWNIDAGINVVEHAVLAPESADTYAYVEADHPDDSEFPGIIGRGSFFLVDENTAEYSQIGHLNDGSASGFVTILKKVDQAPDVPIPQSYPKPE